MLVSMSHTYRFILSIDNSELFDAILNKTSFLKWRRYEVLYKVPSLWSNCADGSSVNIHLLIW